MNTIQSLHLAAVAGLTISSCLVSEYPAEPRGGSISATYGAYDVLPSTYNGEAYYH